MLTINGTDITLTRGDTLTLTVVLKQGTQTYEPPQTDVIRIACSKDWKGMPGYELIFSATIPLDTLTVTIPSTTTGAMKYGAYNYDVEITHDDGCVDTVISGRIMIVGEAK